MSRRKRKDMYEYESIYEDDFAIGFDYENGQLKKQKGLLDIHSPGKTNKTEDSPDDILQIAVQCKTCGAFMDFVVGDGWCNGKYVCPICSISVNEADPINEIMKETSRWTNEFNDIFGDDNI